MSYAKRSAKHRAGLIHIFPLEAMGIVLPISPGVIGLPKRRKAKFRIPNSPNEEALL